MINQSTVQARQLALCFCSQEYVAGGELFNYLGQVQRLDNDSARFYAAEIALAFEYLHSYNVVYRGTISTFAAISATFSAGIYAAISAGISAVTKTRLHPL